MSLLRTVHVYDQKPVLDKAADFCLEPVRTFFGGREVYWEKGAPACSFRSGRRLGFAMRDEPYKTLAKIAVLVPALIVGAALKLLALATSRSFYNVHFSYKVFSARPNFSKTSFTAPPLDEKYKEKTIDEMADLCREKYRPLYDQFDKSEIWDNPEFITLCTQNMELGWQKAQLLFANLAKECGNDKEKMAELLKNQRTSPNYCYPYFRCSVTELYHMARGRYFYETTIDCDSRSVFPSLTRDQALCFYDPSKPQYQWRMLYNNFCGLIDQYGLRELMRVKDPRFVNWAIPDIAGNDSIEPRHQFPDTQPT